MIGDNDSPQHRYKGMVEEGNVLAEAVAEMEEENVAQAFLVQCKLRDP